MAHQPRPKEEATIAEENLYLAYESLKMRIFKAQILFSRML